MLTLVTADLHLSANPRDAYRHKMLRRLHKRAAELGVRRTIINGDLTEEKDKHSDWLVNQVVRHITAFADLGPVYINKGNHDYLSDPDLPFFYFLRHLPQVRWINRPTACSLDAMGRVVFLPHTRNYRKEWAHIHLDTAVFVFAHCTVERTRLAQDRTPAEGVPLKFFPRGVRVIAGDVHIPQQVSNVTYVGAPYHVDFGDTYQGRFLIIDGKKVISHDLHGPQKQLIEFTHELCAPPNHVNDWNKNDIVKVRVSVPRSQIADWPALRDRVKKWATRMELKLHATVPVIVEDHKVQKRIRRAEVKSDAQVMKEFARTRGIDHAMLHYGEKYL